MLLWNLVVYGLLLVYAVLALTRPNDPRRPGPVLRLSWVASGKPDDASGPPDELRSPLTSFRALLVPTPPARALL